MPVVYLLRHGEALAPTSTMSDRDRILTDRGRQDIGLQGEMLGREQTEPLRIFHSPYVRTTETATLINKHFQATLEIMPELVPSGYAERVIDMIRGIGEDLLLVTHLPLIADIAAEMLDRRLPFFPGTCAAIQREDAFSETGKLIWFRHPE